MLRCQCNQSFSPCVEKRISAYQKRTNALRVKRSKRCFDLLIGASIENDKSLSQPPRRFLHVPDLHPPHRRIWVYQQRYDLRPRNELAQQAQTLCSKGRCQESGACDIAVGPVKAGH
jgi:hypothetical protein